MLTYDEPISYDSISYSYDGIPISPEVEIPQVPGSGAGGGWDEGGTGYVWKDHGWVKATKVARVGISVQFAGRPSSAVITTLSTRKLAVRTHQGGAETASSAQSRACTSTFSIPPASVLSNSFFATCERSVIVSRYNGVCETLSLDELVALMGMAA